MPGNMDSGVAVVLGDFIGWWRAATETPFDELVKARDFFHPLEPNNHLGEFVLAIGCSVRIFCEVDVKAFGVLRVVVIGCPEEPYRRSIVEE